MTQQKKLLKQQTHNIPLLVLSIMLFYTHPLFAREHHSHEQIRNTAVEFVRSQIPEDINIIEIKAGKIDSRIKFKQCSQTLEANSNITKQISKNWTIGVRCDDETPWSIYIPVKTRLSKKMLLSKTTITRGEVITIDKITLMEQEINHRNQKHFSDANNITGREARRTIRPNRVINSSMLQEALLVRKREPVLIYAKSQTIQISMKGTALKNGRYNEMIKVRNNSSKKIIDAIVIDRGIVAVTF